MNLRALKRSVDKEYCVDERLRFFVDYYLFHFFFIPVQLNPSPVNP
jgi:hypothetical protein